MSTILEARGGWWHDYVCPTHGVELDPAVGDTYPCRYGCSLEGEPFAGAWVVMHHQARAREARLLARRGRTDGSTSDRDRAVAILTDFAGYYAQVAAGGTSERAEAWMLPGKLFSQALTEAIWAVQIADAVQTLSAHPDSRAALGDPISADAPEPAGHRHAGLAPDRRGARRAGEQLCRVVGRGRGRVVPGPVRPRGTAPTIPRWTRSSGATARSTHLHLATDADGWEWEGSTYYHLFVLRAYLLSLQGADPAGLPADALRPARRNAHRAGAARRAGRRAAGTA